MNDERKLAEHMKENIAENKDNFFNSKTTMMPHNHNHSSSIIDKKAKMKQVEYQSSEASVEKGADVYQPPHQDIDDGYDLALIKSTMRKIDYPLIPPCIM
jgi:hypothetical protein